jgi:hypothetical protein
MGRWKDEVTDGWRKLHNEELLIVTVFYLAIIHYL